jgi:hypothetical protein
MDRAGMGYMERVLLEIYYRGREEAIHRVCPRVTVLLTHNPVGPDLCRLIVDILPHERAVWEIWADDRVYLQSTAEKIRLIGKEKRDWVEEAKDCLDFLLLPSPSFSLISRIIALDDSCPFAALALWALFSGKPVGVLTPGVDPYHRSWKEAGLDGSVPLLKQEVRKRLSLLRGYGVTLLEPEQIREWLQSAAPGGKSVVTEADIRAAAKRGFGSVFTVSRKALVTPLAADLASAYGITIEKR